jgi:uncharacterized membrane protein YhaH (DUF805 family)
MNYYLDVLKKYVVFNGRTSRKEYWMFVLFNTLIIIGLIIIEGMLGMREHNSRGPLTSLYNLAVLLPSIGVAIRRMHDVNKSGWYSIIPIYNLILALTAGTKGANKYGSDPWEPTGATGANTSNTTPQN